MFVVDHDFCIGFQAEVTLDYGEKSVAADRHPALGLKGGVPASLDFVLQHQVVHADAVLAQIAGHVVQVADVLEAERLGQRRASADVDVAAVDAQVASFDRRTLGGSIGCEQKLLSLLVLTSGRSILRGVANNVLHQTIKGQFLSTETKR